eukprot:Skav207107  [mRNA]  locus=scaffold156:101131:103893:- [translate_table: standard]
MHFSVDGLPTWRARRIDHILYNSSFVDLSRLIGSSHCPWATLQVCSDLQAILEVDHALLLCETLFRVEVASSNSKQRRRLRANFFRQRPCKMMVTDDAAIQSFVYTHVGQSHLRPGHVYSSLTRLVSSCSRPGELPAFFASAFALWGIWFIDDAICFFRNSTQYMRLVPSLVAMLASLGLTIIISKSCALACAGPPRSLACLPGLPHAHQSVYLGLRLLLQEGDDHMLQDFLQRTSAAFFSNRILLISASAPRRARLRMFQALVTSSMLWSLAVLSPSASHLRALRVHHVTLMGWLLRCAPHPSWQDPDCVRCARHAVKLWIRCFSKLWDRVLLEQQWRWIGHILRMPAESFVRQTLLNLVPTSRQFGHRRAHTGPNNSGHRILLRWLHNQGHDFSAAMGRLDWRQLESDWLARFGIPMWTSNVNIFPVAATDYLPDSFRAIQGCFRGQQLFVMVARSNTQWFLCELDRRDGWRSHTLSAPLDLAGFLSALHFCIETWCQLGTFHCRCLILSFADVYFPHLWPCLPAWSQILHSKTMVCEVSLIPTPWLARMTRELTSLMGSC